MKYISNIDTICILVDVDNYEEGQNEVNNKSAFLFDSEVKHNEWYFNCWGNGKITKNQPF